MKWASFGPRPASRALIESTGIAAILKVGDTKPTQVNVRILAATNRNLQEEVTNGVFRSDLYYRLSVFTITLPALRDRKKDIKLLAEYFMNYFGLKVKKQFTGLSDKFIEKLEAYNWPGNIRELKNIIERAVILADDDLLGRNPAPLREARSCMAVKRSSADFFF